jgi:deoxyribodipyrimidine photo-lyase
MLTVVWFKRDLRVFDHLPLAEASQRGAVLPLYIYEPEIVQAPDYAAQHLGFTNECLADLHAALIKRGSALLIEQGEVTNVLQRVLNFYGSFQLVSHQETGNAISYARDLRVALWCRNNQITWTETPANGVVRRLFSRDNWTSIWMQRMREPILEAPQRVASPSKNLASTGLLNAAELGVAGTDKPLRQRGGRRLAAQQIHQFFDVHLPDYRYSMSSPLSAEESCSRLSPYLAYGVLSVREVMHKIWKTRAEINALPEPARPRNTLASLKSFESRLHWHCHFIQKLESEPEIENQNVHHGFDGLREPHFNSDYFERWCHGETGFPLIDACMKMLAQTGWINFRMRALLVSFSSYQLWNHWREPALHLAREFLDYEPGIHYPQVQMQSGVTGINILRIYNPIKQAQDQDPDGKFVKRWLPRLRPVPAEFIFQPWTMPENLQREIGVRIGVTYPKPIVDHLVTARHARDTLWKLRGETTVRKEAQQVLRKHGSRNKAREGQSPRKRKISVSTTQPDVTQLSLNLE